MSPILERLYALMHERGVNAKQVSETLHMSNSAFTDWKKGKAKPGVEALSKLAEYFDVTLDYLILGRETVPAREPDENRLAPAIPERMVYGTLDSSSPLDDELYAKFHRLPPENQGKVMAYIDGMLAALPTPASQRAEPPASQPESLPVGPNEDGGRMLA